MQEKALKSAYTFYGHIRQSNNIRILYFVRASRQKPGTEAPCLSATGFYTPSCAAGMLRSN